MCRMVKNIGKTLLVLPVAIAPFLSQMSVGRIDASVTGLFIGAVFGRITEGDMSSLVIVIGKLAYLLLFLGGSLWGCCMISLEKPGRETWRCFFITYAVCVSLLLLTTLIINLGIIVWKTAVGFSVCWIGIIVMEILAKATLNNPCISFINPMSYSGVWDMSFGQVLIKIVYLYFGAVSVSVYGMVFFKKYDITLREVD